MRSNVTNRDKLNILWIISSPKVQSFLDRQPEDTMSNYHVLRQALITEFTIPESDQGLVFAAESKQVKHEASQAYDNRPRWTFLGACNDPDKRTEENLTWGMPPPWHHDHAAVERLVIQVSSEKEGKKRQHVAKYGDPLSESVLCV